MRKILFLLLIVGFVFGFQPAGIRAQSGDDQVLRFCRHGVESLAWSPDGELLAVQGFRGTWLYDKQLSPFAQFAENYSDIILNGDEKFDEYSTCWGVGVSWHPDGSKLVAPFYSPQEGMSLKIWNVDTAQLHSILPSSASDIVSLQWSFDGENIAAVSRNTAWSIMIWNMEEVQFGTREFAYTPFAIQSLEWRSDNTWLASGIENGLINIWDTSNLNLGMTDLEELIKEFRKIFVGHKLAVNDLAWNPSGTLLASASDDATIRIWDFATGETVMILAGHEGAVNAIDWNADGTLIASAGDDATVRIWEVATGENILTLEGHEDSIHALDWSPDDSKIATASRDDTVRLWQIDLPE